MTTQEKQILIKIALRNINTEEGKKLAKIVASFKKISSSQEFITTVQGISHDIARLKKMEDYKNKVIKKKVDAVEKELNSLTMSLSNPQ